MPAQKRREFKDLIDKYLNGTATPEEKAALDRYYLLFDEEPESTGRLDKDQLASLEQRMEDDLFSRIRQPEKSRRLWPRIAAAAAILLIAGGAYFLVNHNPVQQPTAVVLKHDVAPGGTKAILTLSNGQQIVLNNQQGRIASQGNTTVFLSAKGAVNYSEDPQGRTAAEDLTNTLTVPIGNHRDITLADGTEVSLDAGSSITYPVAFARNLPRIVSITGQAYFKVRHDAAQPFQVKVKGLTVEDIGTEFNINAYDDEAAVKTTLVEGSVKVNSTLLKPGQQAVAANQMISVKTADVEAVTAWKNNDFLFRKEELQATMRQIARWYNVRVVYVNAPEHLRIKAQLSRNKNLSGILKAIEGTGSVKFKIDGNTVTVFK